MSNDEWVRWNAYCHRKAQRRELEALKAKAKRKG